ncbi:hypothetical protein BCY86_00085 [Pajaroellobacter abortibovis]|uniref:Uncharacterized protein n=1 Tax=Pajaroellobacter abortibovis TaxID=1882918 RepID=A0A1L6MUT6_9BACT|nr:hypothetical protein BCY86_00085 [Pajaroellobacter abortibovis]
MTDLITLPVRKTPLLLKTPTHTAVSPQIDIPTFLKTPLHLSSLTLKERERKIHIQNLFSNNKLEIQSRVHIHATSGSNLEKITSPSTNGIRQSIKLKKNRSCLHADCFYSNISMKPAMVH